MKKSFLFVLAALMVLLLVFSGCEANEPESTEASDVPETSGTPGVGPVAEEDVPYAGPMVDNILAALESRDYVAFSKDMGDTMKAAMTEDAFNSLAGLLADKVGSFQQVSFGEGANVEQNGVMMTVIVYIAKYSEEPGDVLVTITFAGEEAKTIEGLYFNSPKLREQ